LKKSKLYGYIVEILDGKDIDSFDIGISSKNVLYDIKGFLERDGGSEFKNKLLKSHKINLSIAERLILEKQSEERREQLREERREQLREERRVNSLDTRPKEERIERRKNNTNEETPPNDTQNDTQKDAQDE